jgi:hypothetical protein
MRQDIYLDAMKDMGVTTKFQDMTKQTIGDTTFDPADPEKYACRSLSTAGRDSGNRKLAARDRSVCAGCSQRGAKDHENACNGAFIAINGCGLFCRVLGNPVDYGSGSSVARADLGRQQNLHPSALGKAG